MVKPYPLLLVGIMAFMLAMNTFAAILVLQLSQQVWLWILNAIVVGSDAAALAWCCYRANGD